MICGVAGATPIATHRASTFCLTAHQDPETLAAMFRAECDAKPGLGIRPQLFGISEMLFVVI